MQPRMEQDEIRKEIERRRQRAKDLNLREALWTLYNSHLKYCKERLKNDPEEICPEIRDELEVSEKQIRFKFLNVRYRIDYEEGRVERESWGDDDTLTTPINIALNVEEQCVFEFSLRKVVIHTPDMPIFNEYLGNILGFIEGPWVNDLLELLSRVKMHEKALWEKRRAPKVREQLQQDMKKFGL